MLKRIRVRGEIVHILSDNDRVPPDQAHHKKGNVVGWVILIDGRFEAVSVISKAPVVPLFSLIAAACSAPAPTTNAAAPSPGRAAQSAAPAFDVARIETMKKKLLAEPKIGDVMYRPDPVQVAWTVAVHSDGTAQRGYAQYVCVLLSEQHLVGQHTDVRVVDIRKVQLGDFRAASLGHVDCATSEDLGA
jgi:hypothetical protein